MNKRERVLLGMSGGVDSSMCAWYLLQEGYEVVGITFNTVSPLSSPDSTKFIDDAKKLASQLQIEHHVIDVYNDFKSNVIDYFLDEYLLGRTPNPCIRCNETIKWKLLVEEAEKLQCDKIATGHYVRLHKDQDVFYIQKGIDPTKDQSYFLWNLPQATLKRCVFPLGNFTKSQVKEKAKELGFVSRSQKKESMGVCFLQGTDYRDFIDEQIPDLRNKLSNGKIVNHKGEHIGSHEGFPYYTIGQKRGLQLNNNQGECVAKIDASNNVLITAPKNSLFQDHLVLNEFFFNDDRFLNTKKYVDIRIRGLDAVPPTPGKITIKNNDLHIYFDTPVWAITPGQSIVFYEEDYVVGGGIVDEL